MSITHMKKIKVIIERAKDGTYSSYGETVDGIYGMGDTVQEAKESALKGLKLFVENNEPKNIPAALKGEYEIVFKYDTVSLLNYYKGKLTLVGLEHITGINRKQLQHYASGLKKPRPEQTKKIETALHALGSELMAVEL
jgi:predicted RNase H-like HicB family nuclease